MGTVSEQTVVVIAGGIFDRGVGVIIEFPPPDKVCRPGGAGLQGTWGEADSCGCPGITDPVGGFCPEIIYGGGT